MERMKREYKVECDTGKPSVNYREAITQAADFDYTHKKQSGGQGQYGRVVGRLEPAEEGGPKVEFVNGIVGSAISPGYIVAVEKGFREAVQSGALIGYPVEGVKVTLTDGASHAVDSSELAFKIAATYAFRAACEAAAPVVLEPVMKVEVTVPAEFQGATVGSVNRRKGMIQNSEQQGDDVILQCEARALGGPGGEAIVRPDPLSKVGSVRCVSAAEASGLRGAAAISGAAEQHVWLQHGAAVDDAGQGRVHHGVCAPRGGDAGGAGGAGQAVRPGGRPQDVGCVMVVVGLLRDRAKAVVGLLHERGERQR